MRRHLLINFLLGLVGAVVLAVAISLFTTATATTSFHYAVTDLGALDGYSLTFPYRINDLGQVVGWVRISQGRTPERAFLWQDDKMTDLGTLGGNQSRAFGINSAGQVVGNSLTSNGNYHAFVWQNGAMTDLGTDGSDTDSAAIGINNSGQIVGSSSSEQNISHAVLWQNGGVTNLGTLRGDNVSLAFSINNWGQIFGWSYNRTYPSLYPGTSRIFQWQNGRMRLLGNLLTPNGYGYSRVTAINTRGQAVGYCGGYSGGSFPTPAFVWQNGTLTQSGDLGGDYSAANDINRLGTVVGYSDTVGRDDSTGLDVGINHAFIWRNGIMRDLNDLLLPNSGWELFEATGINNKGQIVGNGAFNGQPKGFLLTPITVYR
jgi:probable HAF family extracellular repeat protein